MSAQRLEFISRIIVPGGYQLSQRRVELEHDRFSAPRRGGRQAIWPDDVEELLVSSTEARQERLTAALVRARLIPAPPLAPRRSSTERAAAAPRVRRGAKARWSKPAWLWGAFGFGFGIVFWHWIGFWSFVAEVVLPVNAAGHQVNAPAVAPSAIEHPTLLPSRSVRPSTSKPGPASLAVPDAPVEPGAVPGAWPSAWPSTQPSAWTVTVDPATVATETAAYPAH